MLFFSFLAGSVEIGVFWKGLSYYYRAKVSLSWWIDCSYFARFFVSMGRFLVRIILVFLDVSEGLGI